jgi:hypothetical protein
VIGVIGALVVLGGFFVFASDGWVGFIPMLIGLLIIGFSEKVRRGQWP